MLLSRLKSLLQQGIFFLGNRLKGRHCFFSEQGRWSDGAHGVCRQDDSLLGSGGWWQTTGDAGQRRTTQGIARPGWVDFGCGMARDMGHVPAGYGQHPFSPKGDEKPGIRAGRGCCNTPEEPLRFVGVQKKVIGVLEQRPHAVGFAICQPGVCSDGEARMATRASRLAQRLDEIPLPLGAAQGGNMDHMRVTSRWR
jgi:hypothetical protein